MSDFLAKLPVRFQWTLHNMVAHPLGEILYQLGFERLDNMLHDATVPAHVKGSGRG